MVSGVTRQKSPAVWLTYAIVFPALWLGGLMILAGAIGAMTSDATPYPTTNGQPRFPITPDPAQIERGQMAYQIYCTACHGPDAHGLPGLGKDLVASEFARRLSDAALRDFIIQGRPAWDAANTTGIEMPPRGGHANLSDGDIEAIVAYLRSLQRAANP